MSNIPVIDMIFMLLIALMVIHGYVKGFIEEIFSWVAIVLGILAAFFLHSAGADYIRKRAMQDVRFVPEILAFAAIFLIIMLFLKMVERILKDVIMEAKLGNVNRSLGAIFGLIEGLVLTTLILFILSVQPLFDPSKLIGDSIFAEILLPVIKIPVNRGKEIVDTAFFVPPGISFPHFRV